MENREYSLEKQLHLTRIIKRGAVSLYIIALLSVVNILLLTITKMAIPFFTAFGVTSAMTYFMTGDGFFSVFLVLVALAFTLLFTILGIYGRRIHTWAFFTGFLVYTADCLLLILLQDWYSVILHAIIIYFIFAGLDAAKQHDNPNTPS